MNKLINNIIRSKLQWLKAILKIITQIITDKMKNKLIILFMIIKN